ncbi:MAG TPA: 7-cyano-7-deazaguanine synthase [Candidatus Obscuribacterales bacterium]
MAFHQLFFPDHLDASTRTQSSIAVLASGGVESAVLTLALAAQFEWVKPLYVRFGLRWEEAELQCLRRFLSATAHPRIAALTVLDLPITDLLSGHWSITGDGVPDDTTADEAVYIPGRNILFISKAAVWCAINRVRFLAHGSLSTNPFPDATEAFFSAAEEAAGLAMAQPLSLLRPFSRMHKKDVLDLGRNMPLELTFSCIAPVRVPAYPEFVQCGRCNKCHERRVAFMEAGLSDRTTYATIAGARELVLK